MRKTHRTKAQLAGTFMMQGRVMCVSPEEYSAFTAWAREREIPVETDIDPETGNVTFSMASADTPAPERNLDDLIHAFHAVGSLLLEAPEYREFAAWARDNNVPFHQQVDRDSGRIIVMKRAWGTVEMG